MNADRAVYLDSSAIVKLAVAEPESAALRRYLRRRRPLVTSALAFAVIHWEPAQSSVALPIGVLLGWLRWRSNSLVPSLIAHAVNNSAFVVVAAYFDI